MEARGSEEFDSELSSGDSAGRAEESDLGWGRFVVSGGVRIGSGKQVGFGKASELGITEAKESASVVRR